MNPILLYEAGKSRKKFVSIWNTSSANQVIALPLIIGGVYNMKVDWGDGSSEGVTISAASHNYVTPGDHTITITGICTGWQTSTAPDATRFVGVLSWGPLKITTSAAFQGCVNLHLENVTDILDVSGTTSFNNMFTNCNTLTTIGRSNDWNVGHITLMQSTFGGCTNFNSSLNGWNTANVTQMTSTFSGCTKFNSALNWDVSKVINFQAMFSGADLFNNGGAPGVSTPMNWILNPVGGIVMTTMFNGCGAFNGEIATNAPYWDMSRVTNMASMLPNNTTFNQPIGNWNMSNVTTIANMLQNGPAFRQNLGAWTLTNVAASSMASFMFGKTVTTFPFIYLDNLYNGWTNSLLTSPQTISFSTAKQSKASIEGRALLTRPNTTLSVTAVTGSAGTTGLVRITTGAQTLVDGNKVYITGLASVGAPNGAYVVDQQSTTQVDLVGTSYNNTTYVSGGNMRTGYAWTITDGLLTITTISAGAGGLVRVTTNLHGFTGSGTQIFIYGNTGTPNINGIWTITVFNTTAFDLQSSAYGAGGFTNNGFVVFN